MSSKGFSKLVIAAGVILMVIGINMDITVPTGYGRVANIHLASQQQMIVLLGGFIFLGGLILFGVARMKQTREDEAKEVEAASRRAEDMVQKGKEIASTASDIALRSSESAVRLGKEAYVKTKGILKIAAYIIGGVFIAFVIAGYYLSAQRANAKAEQVRMEDERTKAEQDKRFQYFKAALTSGKFLGYSFGEKNLTEIAAQLGQKDYKPEAVAAIRCNLEQCSSLAGYPVLAPALEGVQFEFCNNTDGYALTKIELSYKSDTDAKVDFERLKAESYQMRQIDANTTESIEYLPPRVRIVVARIGS